MIVARFRPKFGQLEALFTPFITQRRLRSQVICRPLRAHARALLRGKHEPNE